jgi:hypothetical protein
MDTLIMVAAPRWAFIALAVWVVGAIVWAYGSDHEEDGIGGLLAAMVWPVILGLGVPIGGAVAFYVWIADRADRRAVAASAVGTET